MYTKNKFKKVFFLLPVFLFIFLFTFSFNSNHGHYGNALFADEYGVIITPGEGEGEEEEIEEEPEEEVEEEEIEEEEVEVEPEEEIEEEEETVQATHTPVDTRFGGMLEVFVLSSVVFLFGIVLIVNGRYLKNF